MNNADGSIILKTKVDTGGLKSGMATIAKAGDMVKKSFIAAGLAISTAAISIPAILKSAVSAYADFEQLTGGVETMFKTSADKIKKYAEDAFYTAGMSANQYMETVTAFSAALIKSTGNNTDAAADIANMALQDISDNVNKMGSAMESVQAAYQGFAKQQYTLLDNLKLGYGGTKTEMERLLKDAEKITKQKYDINKLADVYSAIHAIQKELGITGTTAKEAEKTISGSANMMKASWGNVLAAIAGGGDLDRAIQNLVFSVQKYFENIVPVVERAIAGIGNLVRQLAPMVVETIAYSLIQALPSLLASIYYMIEGLFRGIINGIVSLFTGKKQNNLSAALNNNIKSVADSLNQAKNNMKGLTKETDKTTKAAEKAVATFDELNILTDPNKNNGDNGNLAENLFNIEDIPTLTDQFEELENSLGDGFGEESDSIAAVITGLGLLGLLISKLLPLFRSKDTALDRQTGKTSAEASAVGALARAFAVAAVAIPALSALIHTLSGETDTATESVHGLEGQTVTTAEGAYSAKDALDLETAAMIQASESANAASESLNTVSESALSTKEAIDAETASVIQSSNAVETMNESVSSATQNVSSAIKTIGSATETVSAAAQSTASASEAISSVAQSVNSASKAIDTATQSVGAAERQAETLSPKIDGVKIAAENAATSVNALTDNVNALAGAEYAAARSAAMLEESTSKATEKISNAFNPSVQASTSTVNHEFTPSVRTAEEAVQNFSANGARNTSAFSESTKEGFKTVGQTLQDLGIQPFYNLGVTSAEAFKTTLENQAEWGEKVTDNIVKVKGPLEAMIDLWELLAYGSISETDAQAYSRRLREQQELLDNFKTVFSHSGSFLPMLSPARIPGLATGGIVPRATLAQIGESGREVVLPLENNTEWMDMLAERLAAQVGSRGQTAPVILQMDGREFGRAVVKLGKEQDRITGTKLSY